jgi:hypothetical protein
MRWPASLAVRSPGSDSVSGPPPGCDESDGNRALGCGCGPRPKPMSPAILGSSAGIEGRSFPERVTFGAIEVTIVRLARGIDAADECAARVAGVSDPSNRIGALPGPVRRTRLRVPGLPGEIGEYRPSVDVPSIAQTRSLVPTRRDTQSSTDHRQSDHGRRPLSAANAPEATTTAATAARTAARPLTLTRREYARGPALTPASLTLPKPLVLSRPGRGGASGAQAPGCASVRECPMKLAVSPVRRLASTR